MENRALESFIGYIDNMTIAEESELSISDKIFVGLGATVLVAMGVGSINQKYNKFKNNQKKKKEEAERNRVYDTVYVLDMKKFDDQYPLSEHGIYLGLNKIEPLMTFAYTVPSNIDRSNKTIDVAKSVINKLMSSKVYLYSLDGTVVGTKRFVKSSDIKTIPIKNVETGTFRELCEKHDIKVTSFDDSFKDKRLKVYETLYKQLSSVSKKYKSNNLNIGISRRSEFDIKEFIYGLTDSISLLTVEYNFKGDDSDEEYYNSGFYDEVDALEKELNQKVPDGFTISQDWDKWEGYIYLEATKK